MCQHCEGKVSNDRPKKALSMHIQLYMKNCLSSHGCHIVKIILASNSFMHMFNYCKVFD